MYFDDFQKIIYDFDVSAEGTKFIAVRDITKNIRFKTEFINNISIYESYKMKDGETIEMIAEKLYGSPDYHWIIMLLNQRFDYLEEYPLDGSRFEEMVEAKYGVRKNDPKHYLNGNNQVTNALVTVKMTNPADPMVVDQYLFDKLDYGCVIRRKTAIGDYTGVIVDVLDDNNLGVLMMTGGFKAGDPVTVYRYEVDENGNRTETLIGSAKVISVDVPINFTEVTNYEYEFFLNEKKRIIKILPKPYLQQVLREFDEMMK